MERLIQQRLFADAELLGADPQAAPVDPDSPRPRYFLLRRRPSRRLIRAVRSLYRALAAFAAGEEGDLSVGGTEAPLGYTPKGKPRKRRGKSLFYLIPDVDDVPDEFYDHSQAVIYQRAEMLRNGLLETKSGKKIPKWSENREKKRNCYESPEVSMPTFAAPGSSERQRDDE